MRGDEHKPGRLSEADRQEREASLSVRRREHIEAVFAAMSTPMAVDSSLVTATLEILEQEQLSDGEAAQ